MGIPLWLAGVGVGTTSLLGTPDQQRAAAEREAERIESKRRWDEQLKRTDEQLAEQKRQHDLQYGTVEMPMPDGSTRTVPRVLAGTIYSSEAQRLQHDQDAKARAAEAERNRLPGDAIPTIIQAASDLADPTKANEASQLIADRKAESNPAMIEAVEDTIKKSGNAAAKLSGLSLPSQVTDQLIRTSQDERKRQKEEQTRRDQSKAEVAYLEEYGKQPAGLTHEQKVTKAIQAAQARFPNAQINIKDLPRAQRDTSNPEIAAAEAAREIALMQGKSPLEAQQAYADALKKSLETKRQGDPSLAALRQAQVEKARLEMEAIKSKSSFWQDVNDWVTKGTGKPLNYQVLEAELRGLETAASNAMKVLNEPLAPEEIKIKAEATLQVVQEQRALLMTARLNATKPKAPPIPFTTNPSIGGSVERELGALFNPTSPYMGGATPSPRNVTSGVPSGVPIPRPQAQPQTDMAGNLGYDTGAPMQPNMTTTTEVAPKPAGFKQPVTGKRAATRDEVAQAKRLSGGDKTKFMRLLEVNGIDPLATVTQ